MFVGVHMCACAHIRLSRVRFWRACVHVCACTRKCVKDQRHLTLLWMLCICVRACVLCLQDLSEEQQKIAREYERRLQLHEEERGKQRKALETEAKKLRGEIQGILDAFDLKLTALADQKLETDAVVYQLQLQVCAHVRARTIKK